MQSHNIPKYVLVILFVFGLWLPILGNLTKIGIAEENLENRELASAPTFEQLKTEGVIAYKSQFERYFNDHFGFRHWLVQWNSWIKYFIFSTSVSPQVIIGKEGWLYYGDEIKFYHEIEPYTEQELQTMATIFEQRQAWLALQGIAYLLVIAPNKSSIYPEYLPDYITPTGQRTRTDQLVAYLHTHLPDLPVILLHPMLYEAKQQQLVFFKRDTHWNFQGAQVASETILHSVAGLLHFPVPQEKINKEIKTTVAVNGDLAKMLSLHGILKEDWILRQFPQLVREEKIEKELLQRFQLTFQPEILHGKSLWIDRPLLILGDSFSYGVGLSQDFSPYFSRIINLRAYKTFYPDLIAQEQPAVVIQEFVERTLLQLFPANPIEVIDFRNFDFQEIKTLENTPPLFRLNAQTGFDALSNFRDITILPNIPPSPSHTSFTFDVVGQEPSFLLPSFSYHINDAVLLRIALTSSTASKLKVFYKTIEHPSYSGEQKLVLNLKEGENTCYVRIPQVSLTDRIRLEPKAPGRYVLHRIEGYSWNELSSYFVHNR